MNYKVGIIIINYNNYQDTIECIQSIKKCRYSNYRIYLVDNASTNHSVEELHSQFDDSDDITIIENKVNTGFSGGNNSGIYKALQDGMDFVLLLNNDTVVEPDFIEKLVDVFKYNSKVGIVTGKILYFSKPDYINVAGGHLSLYKGKAILYGEGKRDSKEYDKEMEVNFASGCLQLISRGALEKVGAYNEDYFLYYEDADYCNRVRMNGYKIVYTPKSRIYHKVSSSTGGALSDCVLYYNIRNRLLFVKNNVVSWQQRMVFMIYYLTTFSIKYLRFDKSQKRVCIKGIRDFLAGITGGSYESSYDE